MPSSSIVSTVEAAKELYGQDPLEFLFKFNKLERKPALKQECSQKIHDLFNGISITKKAQGDLLEDVGDVLLRSSDIFLNVETNSKGRVHELDHTCEVNPIFHQFLTSEIMKTRRVLGESKNKKTNKIDVNIIYKAGSIARFQGFSLAILFSRKGITGDSASFACRVTGKFKDADKTCFVVFKDEDYRLIEKYPEAFNLIFYAKLNRWLNHEDFKIDITDMEKTVVRLIAELAPKKFETIDQEL